MSYILRYFENKLSTDGYYCEYLSETGKCETEVITYDSSVKGIRRTLASTSPNYYCPSLTIIICSPPYLQRSSVYTRCVSTG